MRLLAIWVFGVLASGTFGMLIGARLDNMGAAGIIGGVLGGAFAFACARLWYDDSRSRRLKDSNLSQISN